MSITIEQREARKCYIGSSDAPAIMGVDPYRSASDVYLEKIGDAEGFEGNEHTDRGNRLEPVLLDWAAEQLGGVEILRGHMLSWPGEVLCANLDGLIVVDDRREIVEAKTVANSGEWGAEGTDEVPERVIVQTHHAMYMADAKVAWVPVLMPGFRSLDFKLYRVFRNDDLAEAVASAGREFMHNHVRPRVPPADFRPSLEILKRVRREPKKIVPLAVELADRLVVARAACKQAEGEKAEAERSILTALADAEGGDLGDGRMVTYLPSKRRGYTVEETTYRTIRVKTPKEKS